MLSGRFGSLYKTFLVLRVPTHDWWYLLEVPHRELQWGLYCNDALIDPAHSGEMAAIECLGARYSFRCWRVSPENYVSESMQIAADLEKAA